MANGSYTISGEALSRPRPVPDGSIDHLTEQVDIEADRLSGTVKDGVEAVQTASKKYGDLFVDTYAKMIRASMQNGSDVGEHLLALLRAKTPADAFKLNVEFMQKSFLSTQGRFFDVIGMKPAADRHDGTAGQA